ncbi:hypothetical protein YTPLAS73_10970 [Nitrosarchaeum sp.]|nr:hypothetical protein YTPLAS73_10970 [Nitrosarchaeum sp.]
MIGLEKSKNTESVKLDVKEIKYMMDKDWPKDISEIFQDAKEEYLKSISRVNLLEDFK